jgi:hypothetical protein
MNVFGLAYSTCSSCKFRHLSSYVERCVNCLKEDEPGNRFPKYEREDNEEIR